MVEAILSQEDKHVIQEKSAVFGRTACAIMKGAVFVL